MTLEDKLCAINETLLELQASQEEINESIPQTCDINCNTVESLDALDRTITDLEIQSSEQSSSIKTVSQLASVLLEKVNDLDSTLNNSSCITIPVTCETDTPSTGYKTDQQTSKHTETKVITQTGLQASVVQHVTKDLPSLKHLQDTERGSGGKGKKRYITTDTKPYQSSVTKNAIDKHSKDKKTNKELTVNKTSNEKSKPLELNHGKRTIKFETRQCLDNNPNKHILEDGGAVNSRHIQFINENRQTSTKKKQLDIDAQITNVTTDNVKERYQENNVHKNDFGYKQIRCDIIFDNRVSFHGKLDCFQGDALATGGDIPIDPQDETNIKIVNQLPDRVHAKAQSSDNTEPKSDYDKYTFDKPKTMQEWLFHAEQMRLTGLIKYQAGLVKRGNPGHNYVLVLDCSARMEGQKFDTMIKAVKTYINGIKDVSLALNIHDNVGLAVFGELTTVVSEPTCDYDKLLRQIDQLKPGGDAPLVGGLLMGLAGVLGYGISTSFGEFVLQGFAVVFTDSQSENTTAAISLNPAYNYYDPRGNTSRLDEANAVIIQMADRGLRVYYVSVEDNSKNQIMEMALQKTNGKIIKPQEMDRLIRMTQTLSAASNIAAQLRFQRSAPSRDIVKQKVAEITYAHAPDKDCIDFVMELSDPLRASAVRGLYTELRCKTLSLGDRVKRGPDWSYGEQDSRLDGTVIGQSEIHLIWVRWDNGNLDVYLYDEHMGTFSIEKITNYRRAVDEKVAVGCRVERGKDWSFENEDGGRRCQGTVLNVKTSSSVLVRWDCRKIGLYRIGQNGLFEVILSKDSINVSTHHPNQSQRAPNLDIDDKDNLKIDKYLIPVSLKTEVNAAWEYKDQNRWIAFSTDLQIRLEKYYTRNKNGKPLLEINSVSYRMDLRRMKKIHLETRDEIDIRRRCISES